MPLHIPAAEAAAEAMIEEIMDDPSMDPAESSKSESLLYLELIAVALQGSISALRSELSGSED